MNNNLKQRKKVVQFSISKEQKQKNFGRKTMTNEKKEE